ncbi:hypothetical protein LYSHEL_19420 [Lysobacter helvus]|uniref:Uncharacterized protein n=2 Tax=Lysobacteraceae TaxID=32033 RepID=A0ABM7Q6B8_9GAMM|nr:MULTISPECIES: hypothetical protein [Lysobacter]BCT92919.1 hypothetical protein LYSCAS_19430 [Lysobacter caseinilyticus]BCT96071.1 hypothetical protein LYSHEL_19420 [Lysobacter helvus]
MTVDQLRSRLAGLDGGLELVCFCCDEGTRQRTTPFRVYVVEQVHVTRAARATSPGAPLEFGHGPQAREMAVVHITTDF